MNRTRPILLALLLTGGMFLGQARADEDLVVVVGAASPVDKLTQTEVTNIFLGRFKKLPSGVQAVPIDVIPLKEAFYNRLVGKTPAELNAYWARLTFSGQTTPPRQESPATAVDHVATVSGAITYVERRVVDKRVKVVFAFGN